MDKRPKTIILDRFKKVGSGVQGYLDWTKEEGGSHQEVVSIHLALWTMDKVTSLSLASLALRCSLGLGKNGEDTNLSFSDQKINKYIKLMGNK